MRRKKKYTVKSSVGQVKAQNPITVLRIVCEFEIET